jgi:hypothetical protein
LHVLSTPPAFILSQDQTLRNITPFGVKVAEIILLHETTGHRLPITLQLLRFCELPRARFYFRSYPLSRGGDKIADDPLQDVIGLSQCLLSGVTLKLTAYLICYRSAGFSEISNALGTLIVPTHFTRVKGDSKNQALLFTIRSDLNVGLLVGSLVIGFSKICFFERDPALTFTQRGEIIPPAYHLSRVN